MRRLSFVCGLLLSAVAPFAHAISFTRYLMPRTTLAYPLKVAVGKFNVWIVSQDGGLVRVSPTGEILGQFPIINRDAVTVDPRDDSAIVAGPIGITKVTPLGEITTSYVPLYSMIQDLIVGPDDNYWLVDGQTVYRVTRSGQVRSFPMQPLSLDPYHLTAGPDGNIWLAFDYSAKVGKLTPDGALTVYDIPVTWPFIYDIASGSDGNLWVSGFDGWKVTTAGVVSSPGQRGYIVVSDGGGLLWTRFNNGTHDVLSHFDPRTSANGSVVSAAPGDSIFDFAASAASLGTWWISGSAHLFGRVTAAGDSSSWPFSVSGGDPDAIAAGPNQTRWVVEPTANKVVRMAADGTFTEFVLPLLSSTPRDIVRGPDDAMWFTEESSDRIGRIALDGTLTQFPVPTSYSKPSGITVGPDSNLWFTMNAADKVVRLTPAGVFTEFLLPGTGRKATSIVSGPDGNLWFTEEGTNGIGTITTAGVVTELPAGGLSPRAIVKGNDGFLWFAVDQAIVRMSVTGAVTTIPINDSIHDLTIAADGAAWVTTGTNRLYRVTASSTEALTADPEPNGGLWVAGITSADGFLWATDTGSKAIVRFAPDATGIAMTASDFCLDNSGSFSGQVALFTAPSGYTAADFNATIEWEPGFPTPATITSAPGEFFVSGSHTYAQPATQPIVTTVSLKSDPSTVASIQTNVHWTPATLHVPAQFCVGRDGAASVADALPGSLFFWRVSKAQVNGSTSASSVSFIATAEGTVHIEADVWSGECIRTLVADVPVTACPPVGNSLYIVMPCRVIDTRVWGTPPLAGSSSREFQIAGSCGVPFGAQAIVANVTVDFPSGGGWLTLYPGNEAAPFASTLNYRPGKTRANNAVLRLSPTGTLSILNAGTLGINVIIDLNGYMK